MTQKHPLCLYNGEIKELQASDSLVSYTVFNVLDYHAVADCYMPTSTTVSGTDNTAAFQAAIDAAYSYIYDTYGGWTNSAIESKVAVVFFPSGVYKISGTLNVNLGMCLIGEDTKIITTSLTGGDVILIQPEQTLYPNTPTSILNQAASLTQIKKVIVRNLIFSTGNLLETSPNTSLKTSGYCLHLRRVSNAEISNVEIRGMVNGIHIDGCTDVKINNIEIECPANFDSSVPPQMTTTGAITNSALVRFSSYYGNASYPALESPSKSNNYNREKFHHLFTSSITNFTLRCGYQSEYAIYVESADGLIISNGYSSYAAKYAFYFCGQFLHSYLPHLLGIVQTNNIYFDVGPTNQVNITSNAYAGIAPLYFTNCFFGDCANTGLNISGNYVGEVYFNNCSFMWNKYYCVVVSSTSLKLFVDTCHFSQSALSVYSGTYSALLSCLSAKVLSLNNCDFTGAGLTSTYAMCGIYLTGSIETISIVKNNFLNCGYYGDILENSVTVATKSIIGNTTNRTTKINSIFSSLIDTTGIIIAGAAATSGNILKGDGSKYIGSIPGVLSIAGSATPFTLVASNYNCLVSNMTLTLGLSGQLGVANGGTGVSTIDSGYAIKANGQQNFSKFPIYDDNALVTFTDGTTPRKVSITNTTASTTYTTGALVVSGGIGVSGNICILVGYGFYCDSKLLIGKTSNTYYVCHSTASGVYIASGASGVIIGQNTTGTISIGDGATANNPIYIKVDGSTKQIVAGTTLPTGYKYLIVPP
jgi:hypothetical protein